MAGTSSAGAAQFGRPAVRVHLRGPPKAADPCPAAIVVAMARMTPEEANAVNVIASYLAGRTERPPREVVRGLERLASRAHNRIQTGWDEVAVREH